MKTSTMKKICGFAVDFFMDTIAPADQHIRAIEKMSAEEFADKIRAGQAFMNRPPKIDGVIDLFPYKNRLMRSALIEIKNHRNKKIGDLLGKVLLNELLRRRTPANSEPSIPIILIPIPITAKKKRLRGWNQCELILDGLEKADAAGRSDRRFERRFEIRKDILIKTLETEDQVGKSRIERFENLRGSFMVRENSKTTGVMNLKGRNIIVMDDIVTTGATLREAKRTLLAKGARSVICVALAH